MLEIVWRNSLQSRSLEYKVQRIRRGRFGALYAVTSPDLTRELTLITSPVRPQASPLRVGTNLRERVRMYFRLERGKERYSDRRREPTRTAR